MKGHTRKDCGDNTHVHCYECGQQLDPKRAVWLEWDTNVGGPSREPILPERSQGWFAYGPDCVKLVYRNYDYRHPDRKA